MNILDRTARIALAWFSTTTVVFWLATVRGAFDGPSYEWGLIAFHGRGTSGDYWFPVLTVIGSLAVMAGGWRGNPWAFIAIALWNVLLFLAVTTVAVSDPDDFRFRGDTLGIDVSLTWLGPLLFGPGLLVSILAAWRVRKTPASAGITWTARNRWWLAGLVAVLPVQFVLFRFGEPARLSDQIGVLITLTQWFLIDRAFRIYPMPRPAVDTYTHSEA